jgi:hypothetical protein
MASYWFCGACAIAHDCQNKTACETHVSAMHGRGASSLFACLDCRWTFLNEYAFLAHCGTEKHRAMGASKRLAGSECSVGRVKRSETRCSCKDALHRSALRRMQHSAPVAPPADHARDEAVAAAAAAADEEDVRDELHQEQMRLEGEEDAIDVHATVARLVDDVVVREDESDEGASDAGTWKERMGVDGAGGRFRVASRAEIKESLAGKLDAIALLPQKKEGFNAEALERGIPSKTRAWMLEYFRRIGAKCGVAACTPDAPCVHFPDIDEMPEDFLLEVPVVFDTVKGKWILSVLIVPPLAVFQDWLSDTEIADRILKVPLMRGRAFIGNASFCSGLYFTRLLAEIPKDVFPICVGFYSDETSVVGVGQRKYHVGSLDLLNVSLPALDTVRPVMFVPSVAHLKKEELSDAQLALLRLNVFHACWEAVAQAARVQVGDSTVLLHHAQLGPVHAYPVFCLFLGDTPEQDRVQGHRTGGSTREICLRCRATATENEFAGFALRLDRKEEVDELFCRIVSRDAAAVAGAKLQEYSINLVLPFADNLRHFDPSLCTPVCSLHVGRILWCKTLLKLVGKIAAAQSVADLGAAAKKRPRVNRRDDVHADALIHMINIQYRRMFPGATKDLYLPDGKLDLGGLMTGAFLTKLATALPFLVFNILPESLAWVQNAVVLWIQCLSLWLEPGKTLEQIAEFTLMLEEVRATFLQLHELAGLRSPTTRPTFHAMVHAPMDQLLFGDDCVVNTQGFEQSHIRLVKEPFRLQTNRAAEYDSIVRQMFGALFQRSFRAKAAGGRAAAAVALGKAKLLGTERAGATTIREMVEKFPMWNNMIAVHRPLFVDCVMSDVQTNGTWDLTTVPIGVTRRNAPMDFYLLLRARAGSGYRLGPGNGQGSGKIVRTFSGEAVTKNCVVEFVGENRSRKFAVVCLIAMLDHAVLPKRPLLFCKLLEHALTAGAECPRFKLPLLRDSDMQNADSHFLLQPALIVDVHSAILPHTREHEFAYVFATPAE